MADRRPELAGSSIVLVGSFNPAIFHPVWFAQQGLMPEAETVGPANERGGPKIEIIHSQIAAFQTESFVVNVTTDRFSVTTKPTKPGIALRDLVTGTFSVLEHTPVK